MPALVHASASPDSSSAAAWDSTDFCAVLVIDAAGRIVAANLSARQLWAAGERALAGRCVAELFGLKPVPSEAEPGAGEWKVFKALALDRWAMLAAHAIPAAPRETRVRLERAFGGAGSFIATILPRSN